MKAILGITGAVALIWACTLTANGDFTCPPIGSNETAYYPHETNCQMFYQCDNGVPVNHTCGQYEHFNPNPDILACDWAWNLRPPCVDGLLSLQREHNCPTGPSDPEDETIFYPHETDCGQYYMCSNGEPMVMPCAGDMHWNQVLKVCDWPWNIVPRCVEKRSYKPRAPNCPPGPSDPEAETIFFPHETDCGQYYMCSNGEPIGMPCAGDMHWNQVLKVCDWPWNIVPRCVEKRSYKPRAPNCPPGPSDPEAETIFFPHETDCGQYYMCSNGEPMVMPCAGDMHWNQALKVCDWPWNIVPRCNL